MANTVVIFGASGDLAQRKLLPALYRMHIQNRLPANTRVVGVSRTDFEHEAWRAHSAETTAKFASDDFVQEKWASFAKQLYYQTADISEASDFSNLVEFLNALDGGRGQRIFYLSTAPHLYAHAVAQLGATGQAVEANGARRIVIEKPFGTDRNSARALNAAIHRVFSESQVYRIDHYLGKETVQNMLVLRFANTIFEPVWNRNYIDHVQITVAEEVSVGSRGGYYDSAGVLRDMFQNHLLQLLTMTAMEAPVRYEANLIRDEKVKILQAIRPMKGSDFQRQTLRGQYEGYLNEEGVSEASCTATFASLQFWIDNWRWDGVPFYLRSGKAMSCRTTQIVIQFREPPHMMFDTDSEREVDANRLVIQVQPAEGIQLHFQTKTPDDDMRLRLTDLDFRYAREFSKKMPDAYQRLLLDVLNGDPGLFARSDEVDLAWSIIDPIVEAWAGPNAPPLDIYPKQLWGPESSTTWMRAQQRDWFDVCPVLQ